MRRVHRSLRLLLMGLIGTWGLCLLGSSRADEMTLQELIEAVQQNELLYENIDVTLHQKYQQNPAISQRHARGRGGQQGIGINVIRKSDTVRRYVVQGELYRTEETSTQVYGEGTEDDTKTFTEVWAYDGTTSRGRTDHIGNIVRGRNASPRFNIAHGLFTLMGGGVSVPLSVSLGGAGALRAYYAEWQSGARQNFAEYGLVQYKGTASHEGLRCHLVWLVRVVPEGNPNAGEPVAHVAYWLAEERNFIPARFESVQYHISKDVPTTEGRVTDWMEVVPGVWFAKRVVIETLDKLSLQRFGKRVPNWRCEWLAEAVSLEPNHDISFFRDVPFPPGTIVYEVEGGEIKKGYQLGAPTAKAGGGGAPPGRRWWAYLLGAVIVVLGAAAIGVWRWRRTLKASAKA